MAVSFARASVARQNSARPAVARATTTNTASWLASSTNWLPGSEIPKYLEGLPGCYGFDPLRLAEPEGNLQRLREGELINGRWAMLASAGCIAVELLGQGDWFQAPLWAVTPGAVATYLGVPVPFDIKTLLLVEIIAMAGVEVLRNEEKDKERRLYPGGAFDPLGFSKDASKLDKLKSQEVIHGRLAMLAFAGFVSQHQVTGQGPLANLVAHVTNPGANNFATNGISLPPFAFPFLY